MRRKLTLLFGALAAVPMAGVVLLAEGGGRADEAAAPPAPAPRVAPGPLRCDFEGYEGVLNHEAASEGEREVYALGMGYANRGTPEAHAAMRAAFETLDFDPARAPIVSADVDTGRLHLFECATDRCTREEIARDAPAACAAALRAPACMTFAVRVEDRYYCTLGPELDR